jgi:hypothetical protein
MGGTRPSGAKRGITLGTATAKWASPTAHDDHPKKDWRASPGHTRKNGVPNLAYRAEVEWTETAKWMTPTSRDWKDAGPGANVPTNSLLGRQGPRTVRDGLGSSPLGPTSPPLWRTPHASGEVGTRPEELDGELGHRMYRADGTNQTVDPQVQARILMGDSRLRLNPRFVEWLQGLPIGWTEAREMPGSEVSETRSYLSRLRSLCDYYTDG